MHNVACRCRVFRWSCCNTHTLYAVYHIDSVVCTVNAWCRYTCVCNCKLRYVISNTTTLCAVFRWSFTPQHICYIEVSQIVCDFWSQKDEEKKHHHHHHHHFIITPPTRFVVCTNNTTLRRNSCIKKTRSSSNNTSTTTGTTALAPIERKGYSLGRRRFFTSLFFFFFF